MNISTINLRIIEFIYLSRLEPGLENTYIITICIIYLIHLRYHTYLITLFIIEYK